MLMKLAKCACVATIVSGIVLLVGWYQSRQFEWPGFEENTTGKPQYHVQYERDFGYRTGNLVPVRICFKLPAGTALDVDNLTVEGDMSVAKRTVFTQAGKDGVNYIRLDLQLQAFVWKPRWINNMFFNYRTAGSRELMTLELKDVSVSTSKTYDEDKKNRHPKEPDLAVIQGFHLVWTGLWLAVGLFGMIACSVYLVKTRRVRIVPVVAPSAAPKDPWSLVVEALTAIKDGDLDWTAFERLVLQVRAYTGLHTQTASELAAASEPKHQAVGAVLAVCEPVIWGGRPVADDGVSTLETALDKLKA